LLFSLAVVMPVAAESLSTVSVAGQQVTLSATAEVEQIRYFSLDSPKRLVVDLYGVTPGVHAPDISLSAGFSTLRTGTLENRTRFVFDVTGDQFPTFNVATGSQSAVVTWQPAEKTTFSALAEPAPQGSAKVDAIDFTSVDGRSRLLMTISGQSQATTPVRDGNRVQFSLPDTTLPRALRREFDTFAFPSAIHSATPYLVNAGGRPEVRVVVLLKGNVPFQLQKVSSGYEFIVSDGIYAQTSDVVSGQTAVPVDGKFEESQGLISSGLTVTDQPIRALDVERRFPVGSFVDEKTNLTFNDSDVKDALLFIADFSDFNIIFSDQVGGRFSLRLTDVPYEQAFNLILDINNLESILEGNVYRIYTKQEVQAMRERRDQVLAADRAREEKLDPLVTEVVTVSYADLSSVIDPIKEVLTTGRPGVNVIQDSRNKLLIIRDVPAGIERAKELIKILDTPERQVMIEARIIEVRSDLASSLGVNWGFIYRGTDGQGSSRINTSLISGPGGFAVNTSNSNAGIFSPVGAGITIGSKLIDQGVLDIQLSALESSGTVQIISTPRISTLNGESATIEQGIEIPYEVRDEQGIPRLEFRPATLKLEVTPVINPDNSVILEIDVSNDSLSPLAVGAIDKKSAKTKAIIQDGSTTVIGGIFVDRQVDSSRGVPGMKKIPILGGLFRTNTKDNVKNELLIFITPRIVREN